MDMEIDIRANVINNFRGSTLEEIQESITSSVEEKEEITLPGLGVFFELLWTNSDEQQHRTIIETIKKGL